MVFAPIIDVILGKEALNSRLWLQAKVCEHGLWVRRRMYACCLWDAEYAILHVTAVFRSTQPSHLRGMIIEYKPNG